MRTEQYYITNASVQVKAASQYTELSKPHTGKSSVVFAKEKRGRRIESSLNTSVTDKLNSKDLDHNRQKYTHGKKKPCADLSGFCLLVLFCAINSKQFNSSSCEDFQYILIIWTARFD